jgi:serine phosphatase RsbU (regulator of sigma subunit)
MKKQKLPLSLLQGIFFCSCIFSYQLVYGQDLDSLRKVLKEKTHDTAKVNALNAVARAFILKGKYLSADSLVDRSLDLAHKNNFKRGIFNANINKGVIYMYQDNYPESLKFYLDALKIAEALNDKSLIARATANVGLIFENGGDFPKTLSYYFKALKLKQELNDVPGIRALLTNIGRIYKKQGNNANALDYFLRSLKISRESGAKGMIALNLSEIGDIFIQKGDPGRALASFFESLKLCDEIGDHALGPVVREKIGSVYMNQGNYKKAEEFYLSGLQKAKDVGGLGNQSSLNEHLSDLYVRSGNWELSYFYYKQYKLLEDSIKSEKKTKELVSQQLNYEFDKKQVLQNLQHAEEIDDQKKQRNYFIAGSLLILMIAVVVFRSYKAMQKANKVIAAQKLVVEQQKDIVENQKYLIEEKHREITDSINYAERIQRSFLATTELLDQHLKDYFVLFKPKDVVSGDFYWANELKNGNFALVTADSTGHGVPGAIMSILNISSLENAIKEETEPSTILDHTRKTIIERLKKDGSAEGGKDGMDASLIVFSKDRRKISIAAANNPVWIVRGSETIEVKPDKMPVGKHDKQNISFEQRDYAVQRGDVIYTLTDGFPDQFGGEKGKKFMIKKLRELLVSNAHLPMQEQKELLRSTFEKWVGGLEQVDDVTLVGVRI